MKTTNKTIVLTELQHKQIEENSKSKLQSFQRKIYLKSKQNPNYKFYCLYDKVFRKETIEAAYWKVRMNGGKGGIDKMEFTDLNEEQDRIDFLEEIHQELKSKTYKPNRLREVKIPKKNGKMRILRIPTIKDRVIQMAIKLIIEPIFEADFQDNSYGYRPKKSTHDAVKVLKKELFKEVYKSENKRKEIKSIDLTDCFNTIPHKELLQIIAKRIIDRQMLKIIKMIIKSGHMEFDVGESNKGGRGTPQGGVLSPLLANIYLNKLDVYWNNKSKLSTLVRYADDTVIILHPKEEELYQEFLLFLENELKLTVNKEKTKTENIKDGLEYLGFCMKQKVSEKGKKYLAIEPTKDSQNKIKDRLRQIIKNRSLESTEDIIKKANKILMGWQQYFDNVGMWKIRNKMNNFVKFRFLRMISKRKKYRSIRWKLYEDGKMYEKYGLFYMKSLGRMF